LYIHTSYLISVEFLQYEEGDTLKSPQDVNFVAFAAQMAELETHLIEHQISFAAGLLKQAKYEVFKATRRAKLMEKKATHQTSSIEALFLASDDNYNSYCKLIIVIR
jgi:hypothetical protein